MGIYTRLILPRLIDCAMRNSDLEPYRQRAVSLARGRVLEIGIGPGQNLPFYPADAHEITALDPSLELLAKARRRYAQYCGRVNFIQAAAEAIPTQDASFDTVLMTWTLCSVANTATALSEVRRVLSPAGQLLFAEHGLAPEARVRKWQHRIDPLWH